MNTKLFWLVTAILLVLIYPGEAQQPKKISRIGLLSPIGAQLTIKVFREGMRELGYLAGQNVRLEERYAEGKRDRFSGLATELVRLKPDVIVVVGGTLEWRSTLPTRFRLWWELRAISSAMDTSPA